MMNPGVWATVNLHGPFLLRKHNHHKPTITNLWFLDRDLHPEEDALHQGGSKSLQSFKRNLGWFDHHFFTKQLWSLEKQTSPFRCCLYYSYSTTVKAKLDRLPTPKVVLCVLCGISYLNHQNISRIMGEWNWPCHSEHDCFWSFRN